MHKDDLQISEKIFYDELFTRLCIKSKYNIHNKTVWWTLFVSTDGTKRRNDTLSGEASLAYFLLKMDLL